VFSLTAISVLRTEPARARRMHAGQRLLSCALPLRTETLYLLFFLIIRTSLFPQPTNTP